eukprot:4245506-Lingulodinium_polyedra.AAC.1
MSHGCAATPPGTRCRRGRSCEDANCSRGASRAAGVPAVRRAKPGASLLWAMAPARPRRRCRRS